MEQNKNEKTGKVFGIDSELMEYVQYLNSMKDIHERVLREIVVKKRDSRYEYNIDVYEHFMKNYSECSLKYNSIIETVLKDYAPEYVGDPNFNIQFDFNFNIVEIKENSSQEGCSICQM